MGTTDKYKATEGWNDFLFIEEGTGEGGGSDMPQKCETPTISYQNGKLMFSCATDDAVCHSTITDSDIKSYTEDEVQLNVTYDISVYATKLGYENSEMATATLCWIDVEPESEGLENGVAQVRACAVIIGTNNGTISVSGVEEGSDIAVYSVDGHLSGSARAVNRQATVVTNFRHGEIAVVKIGRKSLKIIIR